MSSWGEDSSSVWDDSLVPVDYGYSEVKKPPRWPIILQITLLILSAALYFFGPTLFRSQKLILSIIGYLLTPFLIVLLQAILRSIDLKNRSLPWYDRGLGKIYVKWAGRISLISFLMAAPIIWRLAIEIVN